MATHVQFLTKEGQDPVIFGTDEDGGLKSILGPVSSSIVENAKRGRVALIFSQGDLNITPLLSALSLGGQPNGDVMIGIPKSRYGRLNSQYYNDFFSLIRGNNSFYYKNSVWLSAKPKKNSTDDGDITFDLDNIKFKLKWGTRSYRKEMESRMDKELQNGDINKRSFVVTFPLNSASTFANLDSTTMTFGDKERKVRPISPGFLILESVNETMRGFEPLVPLVKKLLENKVGAVIHFSWPYISGIGPFINSIDELTQIFGERLKLFHIGKRFSLELKNIVIDEIIRSTEESNISSAITHHPAIERLTLEGRNWDSYYSNREGTHLDKVEFCAPINTILDYNSIEEVLSESTSTDHRINALKEDLTDRPLPDRWWYFLRFMPFIDSFVRPDSIKYTFRFDDGKYRRLKIQHAIAEASKKMDDTDSYLFEQLTAIIKNMSETIDLIDYLKGLKTYSVSSKSSAVISFLLKSLFKEDSSDVILCDYNPKFGFKNYMSNYIEDILHFIQRNLPFSLNELPKGDFVIYSPDGSVERSETTFDEIVKLDYNKDSTSNIFEIKLKLRGSNSENAIQRKLTLRLEGVDRLYKNMNYYDVRDNTLLLPGPLPLLRFDGEFPALSEGIDLFLRPFKKVIVFVNKGENYLRAHQQVATINSFLYGGDENPIAKKDLQISYRLNNSPSLIGKFEQSIRSQERHTKSGIEDLENNTMNFDDTIEDSIRAEYLENERRIDQKDYRTLKDLWGSISKNQNSVTPTTARYDNPEDFIHINVRYDQKGTVETIPIRKGTYIRLVDDDDNEAILVENLRPGQRIAYLESQTRESLDNYFIRNYSDYSGITIEEVHEPFTCLVILYRTLSDVDFTEDYIAEDFKPLYWLNDSEKYQLYKSIRFLMGLENDYTSDEASIRDYFRNSIIWDSLSDAPDGVLITLKEVFTLTKTLNLDNLYGLSLAFGLEYELPSFKSLINTSLTGKDKYFFSNENNLLYLARLLNYTKIEDNYEDLTSAGKNIRTVLQLVGKSLKRVITGANRNFNDMDVFIEQRVMICTVM